MMKHKLARFASNDALAGLRAAGKSLAEAKSSAAQAANAGSEAILSIDRMEGSLFENRGYADRARDVSHDAAVAVIALNAAIDLLARANARANAIVKTIVDEAADAAL